MHGIDADFLAASSAVLSGKHSGVRRRLVAVGLHLHTTRHTDDGFLASQISDVHKGIVEAGVDAVVVSICSFVFCRGRGRSFLSILYSPGFQDTYWATPKTIFPSSTLGPSETSWLGAIWSVSANGSPAQRRRGTHVADVRWTSRRPNPRATFSSTANEEVTCVNYSCPRD